MKTRADHHKQPPSDDPSPVAAGRYPRWVLLENDKPCKDPDVETVAYARTYAGRPIRFSFGLATPPAVSRLRVDIDADGVQVYPTITAAHGDSVLVEITTATQTDYDFRDGPELDYFVYSAGNAAANPSRPPSLSLLPPCYLTEQEEGRRKQQRSMHGHGAGLLRRGTDEVLVARMDFLCMDKEGSEPLEAELCVLRSGKWEWDLKRLPVMHDESKRKEVALWDTDKVIPVGDRFLFWVDYYRGIIYSDVWEETPELRYVSLPVKPNKSYHKYRRDGSSYRTVCATDGGGVVRFVEIFARCCCGCRGNSFCARSSYAFNITTWALRMDDMRTWDKVGIVDCDELWSLPRYRGIVPRIIPMYPTVSPDDPDVLCFMVRKAGHDDVDGDTAIRLIEFDTRLIELRSIFYYDGGYCSSPAFVVSTFSQYLGPSSRSRHPVAKRHKQAARPIKLTLPEVGAKVLPGEMLKTLREIPDLARDDMLRTYNILKCDESQFKFRCLLALPMDMRKGYCLVLTGN